MGYKLTLNTIVRVSSELRKEGKKVVYTHGTFDLFHPGHSYLFNVSKKRGDVLIVGMESDEKIKRFKRPTGSLIPQDRRMDMILSHKAVDFAFLITKMTYETRYYVGLYERIFPNKVTYGKTFGYKERFKNPKYALKDVSYERIRELPGYKISTSELIEKIKCL